MPNFADSSKYSFTLFSTYHKKFPVPATSIVHPIHAGRQISTAELGLEGDNTGDNISHLNPYFSELTVIYYIWKNYNATNTPFWGLCHYRRYFTLHLHWSRLKKVYRLQGPEQAFETIFTPELFSTIEAHLKEGKVIVPVPYRFIKLKRWSVKKQYIKDHDANSWNATESVIAQLYPEYSASFNEYGNSLTSSWYNMLIASWQFWDEYLTWLFQIIFEVKKVLEEGPAEVPLRIYGNLSERLINVYLHHHKKKGLGIFYLPVAHIS